MSYTGDTSSPPPPLTDRGPNQFDRMLGHETTLPMVVYALYLIGLFTGGLASIVGVIIAYVQRGKVEGTYLATHYRYQIRTFWIGLLYSAIAFVLTFIGIGIVLAIAVLVWIAIRAILGMNRLAKHQPLPNPTTWLW
jgi:uncharacterized membrane protein